MLAACGKRRAARDGTRGVSSKDGTERLGQGGERLGSLFKQEHSQKDSAVKHGEKANPDRRSAASRGLQTVTALPFYFLLLPSYFLTWQQCHMCITVSRALRAGAGAAGFLPPHLVFARALHCRKDHNSPHPPPMH